MKNFLLLLVFMFAAGLCKLSAQQLNYQGIARNANGVAMAFQEISLRLTIRDGSATGNSVYSETRQVRTNQFGLFTIVIGSPGASNISGSFVTINWISGNKYLQVEIDPAGGTSFQLAGVSQLQSVPYAYFAAAAYPVGLAGGDLRGSTYPDPIIAPKAVNNAKLGDTSVSTSKLIDQSVTNSKIANPYIFLNDLPIQLGQGQYFIIDSLGNNFNILSFDSIHKFNIPSASATKRGLLKSNDWTYFNNKLNLSDTAAMLLPFVQYSDTANQMSGYLRKNFALLLQDTAAALGVRPLNNRFLDTATLIQSRIQNKLNIVDAIATYTPLSRTINGISLASNQVFATTSIGNDFTISASGSTHNFNIPSASSTNRGLLTSTDWSVFNNKQTTVSTAGQNYLGFVSATGVLTAGAINLSGTHVTGTLAAARFGALTGDVTNTAGSYATTVQKIQGVNVSATAPSNNQILKYNNALTRWEPASDGSATQWSITGNSGLIAGTNFLGTTDNQPLQFKVNNTWAGEINQNSSNTSFGFQSGLNNTANANNNTSFGYLSLKFTEPTGLDNTAIGQGALQNNISGDNNTAIGQGALFQSAGINNTAVGQASLRLTVKDNNTAIGRAALEEANSGDDNTAIGYLAGRNYGASGLSSTNITRSVMLGSNTRTNSNTSDNEIVIGYNAIGNGSNTVQLGNTSVTLVNTSAAITAGGRISGTGARFAFFGTIGVNYSITINDYYIKVNSAITLTLPSAVGIAGQRFVIYNATGGPYNSINTILGQTISGAGWSGSLGSGATLKIFSDGSNWLSE